jgi:hypothetical protein
MLYRCRLCNVDGSDAGEGLRTVLIEPARRSGLATVVERGGGLRLVPGELPG